MLDIVIEILNIVESVAVIFGMFFAIYQYSNSKKKGMIVQAAEFAKKFKNDLISPISLILIKVKQNDEFNAYLDTIREKVLKAKNYDFKELLDITNNDTKQFEKFYSEKLIKTSKKSDITILTIESCITDILNNLEYCSIYFNSKMAQDDTVYQSLHQVLFKFLPVAYYGITIHNENQHDKYYTNTIDMYKRWLSKLNKAQKVEEKCEKKSEKKRKKLQIKMNSLEQSNAEMAVTKTPKA